MAAQPKHCGSNLAAASGSFIQGFGAHQTSVQCATGNLPPGKQWSERGANQFI